MTPEQQVWAEWLGQRSDQERHALVTAMAQSGMMPPVASPGAEPETKLLRPPVDDFINAESPPYVDVHGLIEFFNTVAYHYNVLLKGPKGCGKSLAVETFASAPNTPKITMN